MIQKMAMTVVIASTVLCSCVGNQSERSGARDTSEIALTDMDVEGGEMFLLIGTYTSKGGSEGVYLYRFSTDSGLGDSVSMVEVDNPSYLTLSRDERFVYAVSEENRKNSAVHAFALDKRNGRLNPLNTRPVNSVGPCYITIDRKGRNVHTANYGGGSISSMQVNEDGGLAPGTSVMVFSGAGPDSSRQESPHLHSVKYAPDGQFLFAADLGTDKLYRFTVNDSPFEGQPPIHESSLEEWLTPPGTGPRHFAFHPDGGRFLYVLGELSGQVIVYDYHFGDLEQKQVIAADTVGARGSADIHVSPDGRFLYASNRLENDGIAIFSVDPDEGTLSRVGYQPTARHPRNFVITPNGKFLLVASRDDNKIQVFRRDIETGSLADTHQDILISQPVCLKFASAVELQ